MTKNNNSLLFSIIDKQSNLIYKKKIEGKHKIL